MTNSVRKLSPELSKMAEAELNEVPSRIAEDLDVLRTWIAKQPHLRARTNDQFLIAFLRGCKFSMERAKEKVDMYYTIRGAIPEFFASRDPTDDTLSYIMETGLSLPMPQPHLDQSRIFLIKQGAFDPQRVSIMDVTKVSYMISDILLEEDDNTVVAGQTIIVDMKGLGFNHIKQLSPAILRKMTSSIQDAYPIRQKGIHFINPWSGFETLFKIFYSFMSDKMKKRIYVHNSFEDLHGHVSKHLLPEEYGGDMGPIANIASHWKAKLESRRQWFLEDQQLYGTDERKRVGKAKNAENLFGVQGSFRSLEID